MISCLSFDCDQIGDHTNQQNFQIFEHYEDSLDFMEPQTKKARSLKVMNIQE